MINSSSMFKSSRLEYLPITDSEWTLNFMYTKISSDVDSYALSSIGPIVPQSRADTKKMIDSLQKCKLAVLICLPAPEPTEEDKDRKSDTAKSDDPKQIPIGFIALNSLYKPESRRVMIGVAIADGYQNKGYGGEAIEWSLQWAFLYGGVHGVEIGCFEYNDRAAHLYEKLGFQMDGRTRDFIYFKGRWWDEIKFSMLEDEWKDKHPELIG